MSILKLSSIRTTWLLALLVITSGAVSASVPAVTPNARASDELILPVVQRSGGDAAPPDPPTDVLGWEGGYWYDESITVTQSDGLNETERAAMTARAMARVEHLRGLEFTEPVRIETIDRTALPARRGDVFGLPTPEQTWEALFVFGEGTNATEAARHAQFGTVLGYAAEEGADHIVIITRTPANPRFDERTLVHELMHMLQDQHFDLSDPRYRRTTLDGEFAKNGLVEGEASSIDHLFAEQCRQKWTCVGAPGDWSGTEWNGPRRFHRLTYQPYSDGTVYIQTLLDRGGWAAVNAAHRRPPTSTEQIIHPERMDEPVPMTFEDTARNGWERTPGYDTIGEAATFMLFWREDPDESVINLENLETDGPFDSYSFNATPSAGWGNDRLVSYEKDGEHGYVWKTIWDTERDAREFAEAYRNLLALEGGSHIGDGTWRIRRGAFADTFHVERSGSTVRIVNAPTVRDLSDLRPGIEPATGEPSRGNTKLIPLGSIIVSMLALAGIGLFARARR